MNAVLTFPDPAEQIPRRPVGGWVLRDGVPGPHVASPARADRVCGELMARERWLEPAIDVVLLSRRGAATSESGACAAIESTDHAQPGSDRLIAGLREQGLAVDGVVSITGPDAAQQRERLAAALAGPENATE